MGEGPTFKRSQPKARGSAGPIRKRTSHIRIIVTDEIEIKPKRQHKSSSRKKSSKSPASKAPKAARPVPEAAAAAEAPATESLSTQE